MASAPRGLVYVTDAQPGIRRVRQRRGRKRFSFKYYRPDGRQIRTPAVLARLAALAIPPAYEDVWICTNPRGHLQATGRDARGRKQYRYHPTWRQVRDRGKHSRMLHFGAALGRLRRVLRRDLRRSGLPREKVLALVVSLLDKTQIRIGNAEYARANGSYGLTTLQDRHATVRGRRALLRFSGKNGARHDVVLADARLARIVRHCQQLPGQHLFQYVDEEGTRRRIDSGQVNDYLREYMGDDFTAKDFRTWHATLLAVKLLCATPRPAAGGEAAVRRCINDVIAQVAERLRHTPAVCRKSYINPRVFDAWQDGQLGAPTAGGLLRLLRRMARSTAGA